MKKATEPMGKALPITIIRPSEPKLVFPFTNSIIIPVPDSESPKSAETPLSSSMPNPSPADYFKSVSVSVVTKRRSSLTEEIAKISFHEAAVAQQSAETTKGSPQTMRFKQ